MEPYKGKNPTDMDWARLAAYIDGEGCVGMKCAVKKDWPRAYWYIFVTIANTDPRLIAWLHSTFGGNAKSQQNRSGAIHRGQKSPWATCYRWETSCRDAEWILNGCMPFFIIKREQAEVAVESRKLKQRWGVKGAPMDVRIEEQRLRAQLKELKGTSSHHYRSRVEPELSKESIN